MGSTNSGVIVAINTNTKPEVEYREVGGIYMYRTQDMKTFAPCRDENGKAKKVPKLPKIV